MFAYCRNNPVNRIDVSGFTDQSFLDDNPVDEEDLLEIGKGGGAVSSVSPASATKTEASNPSPSNAPNNSCVVVGGGHGNPIHAERINNKMSELEASGEYSEIYGNRSLNTAGIVGSQRPDIIAHNKVTNTYEVWEFASPSQAMGTPGYRALQNKIAIMQAMNPGVEFHSIIKW